MGTAALVLAAPTTAEAWLVLTDRSDTSAPDRADLAERLVTTNERATQAGFAVAKGLRIIGDARRADGVVPDAWIARLCDLEVMWLDALFDLDDVAHEAALVEPAWVEVPLGERAVASTEVGWVRISRLYTRVLQQVSTLTDIDTAWDRLGGMDPSRPGDASDVAGFKKRGRELVRAVTTETYRTKETT